MDNPPPLPGRPGKALKIGILVVAVAAGVAGYYLQIRPEFRRAMAQAEVEQKKASATGNLISIGVIADRYFLDHPDAKEVSVALLKQNYARRLTLYSVTGETYEDLVVPRNWTSLTVTLKSGEHVVWNRPRERPVR